MTNKGFKKILIEFNRIKKKVIVPSCLPEEKINRLFKVCLAYLFQYVYTGLVVTQIFTLEIEKDVKNKPTFKHLVKKRWNEGVQSIIKIIKVYNEHMSNSNFCYEFGATFYDNISPDIYKLRDTLAQKINNLGIAQAGLYANVILLYNLVVLSVKTYDSVIQDLKERYGVDFSAIFANFRNTETEVKSFDLLCAVVGKDYNVVASHITGKEIREFYERIRKGMFNSENLEEAKRNALECSSLGKDAKVGTFYAEEDVIKGKI